MAWSTGGIDVHHARFQVPHDGRVRRALAQEGHRLAGQQVQAHALAMRRGLVVVGRSRAHAETAGEGVDCYHPDGTRLARLHLPEPVANLTFGGLRRNDQFIAATSTIYRTRLKVTGTR